MLGFKITRVSKIGPPMLPYQKIQFNCGAPQRDSKRPISDTETEMLFWQLPI